MWHDLIRVTVRPVVEVVPIKGHKCLRGVKPTRHICTLKSQDISIASSACTPLPMFGQRCKTHLGIVQKSSTGSLFLTFIAHIGQDDKGYLHI
jgi:hypothetical protein